ncbi:MAG TPA: hypothetical protein DEA08_35420 [Planctomycetes bacterium]|nr:hypothetical protein [Planctomycetota bacterium]
MLNYVLKRLLLVPVTLFGIALVTFTIIQLAPGDPAEMRVSPGVGGQQSADKSVSKEIYEKTREQFDLDKPLPMRFVRWLGKLFGLNVEVWSAKKAERQEVQDLLISKYKASSAESIEAQAARLRAKVKEQAKPEDTPEDLAQLAENQLADWTKAQAEKERFKYTAEIDAIRAKYIQQYGQDFEGEFSYSGLSLNWSKSGWWYPLDFGQSFKDDREVLEVLAEKIPVSLELSLLSIFFAYMIAIPLGIHSSVTQGTIQDQVITTILFILYSLPSFWVAIMLLLLVSEGGRGIGLFPVRGLWPELGPGQSRGDFTVLLQHVRHLALPVFCLTYASFAYISRQMRAGMLDVIRQDFIRTARAKGLPERVVIFKHALRNSLIPIITIVAVILPSLVGGSVIIESIFNVDGIGKLSFTAILTRDYPIIMAIFTLSAFLTLIGILISDILYAIVDPQISFEGK